LSTAVSGTERGLVVAIVEDDASCRRSLGRLCRVLGFTAIEFASGAAFLATLDGMVPRADCLLVDKMMPWMTGLELHDALLDRGVSLPTVLITGDADAETRARCTMAGLAACLEKPIEADALLEIVVQAAAGRVANR
jgi:FixJ family two-component response regulator